MFEYNERKNFIDFLRPPVGFKIDRAVGTTYSLDFITLTAALLALLDTEVEDGTENKGAEDKGEEGIIGPSSVIDVIKVMTKLREKVAVFVNKTSIDFREAKSKNRLFDLFDRIVHDKALPYGSFHPKVWLLKYVSHSGARTLYRMICGSRNLRIGNNWELGVVFEGETGRPRSVNSFGSQMSEFCEILFKGEAKSEFRDFIQELKYVDFKLCREMGISCDFLWQYPGGKELKRLLPKKCSHILVVSPFLSGDFVESLLQYDKVTLVSREEELNAMFHAHGQLVDTLLKSNRHKIYVVEPYEDEENNSLSLHAKLFICESDAASMVFLGSANASSSGWERSCEAMVAFSPGISIEKFCSDFIFKRGSSDLNGWISEYKEIGEKPGEDELEKASLDKIQRLFSKVNITEEYDDKNRRLVVRSADETLKEIIRDHGKDCAITFLPLSLYSAGSSEFRDISALLDEDGVVFNAGLDEISEFVILKITIKTSKNDRYFIVKAVSNFSGFLEAREAAYFKAMMNKDRFKDMMLFILYDGASYSYRKRPPRRMTPAGRKRGDGARIFFGEITLEDIIKSCTDDLSRVDEIDHLMRNSRDADYIGQDLEDFWNEFKIAIQKVYGKK